MSNYQGIGRAKTFTKMTPYRTVSVLSIRVNLARFYSAKRLKTPDVGVRERHTPIYGFLTPKTAKKELNMGVLEYRYDVHYLFWGLLVGYFFMKNGLF